MVAPSGRFRILGRIEVVDASIGGPRQVALLAILILHANRPVSTDRLIEELSAGQPSEGAVKRLQVAVTRLRKVLTGTGLASGPLRTVGRGYQLSIEPGELDADVFRERVRDARALLGAAQPAEAAAVLSAALAMWRGPPLADVAFESFAQSEIRRLDEFRLEATELALDAELAVGGHREALAEIEALVTAEPLRERPRTQQMLALYRCGRQGEALAVFHDARRALLEAIGVEPGPDLQRMHDAVLHQDAALTLEPVSHSRGLERSRLVERAREATLDAATQRAEAAPTELRPRQPDPLGNVIALADARKRVVLREAGTEPVPSPDAVVLPAALRVGRVMVGRERELAEVLRLVRARAGAHVVLIAGEAGIGKSTLACQVAQLRPTPASVLYGRCDEEPLMPFQLFAEAVRDLLERRPELHEGLDLGELARIVPELGTTAGAGEGERHRLFEAVASAIAAAGDTTLFVADDLHWADAPTITLLRYVIRRARGSLAILATSRDAGDAGGPLAELAVDLRRNDAFERIRVAGLDVEATGMLIATRTGMPSDREFVRTTHGRTNGNPFFIEQLLDAAVDDSVPDGIKELITVRVSRMLGESGDTLRIASAIGRDFELRDLEPLVAGREAAIASLDAAHEAGMIVETAGIAGRFSFVHAIAREAIYDGMSATRRANVHQRIGEALEQGDPAPAAALAHHFLRARHVAGPEKAVDWAIVAAQQAASALAWEQEVAHYETALRVLDEFDSGDDVARCRILLALADRCAPMSGDFRAACRRAAELAGAHGWAGKLAEAATNFARVGEYGVVDTEAVALLEAALEAIGEHDSEWRARILGRLAESLAFDGRDPERRDALSREGLAIARRLRTPDALVAALRARCAGLDGPDATHERIELLTEALRVAEQLEGRPDWQLDFHDDLATYQLELANAPRARSHLGYLASTVAEHRMHGSYWHAELLRLQASHAIIDGDLPEAERLASESRSVFQAVGDPDADDVWLAQTLAIRLEQNRGTELLDSVAERASTSAGQAPWHAAHCLLLAGAGHRTEARSRLRALAANQCAAIPRLADWLATLTLLADACAELNDAVVAATAWHLLTPYEGRFALFLYGSAPLGPISGACGRLATLLGCHDHAVNAHERALKISNAIPAPRWAERARADLHSALLARADSRSRPSRVSTRSVKPTSPSPRQRSN